MKTTTHGTDFVWKVPKVEPEHGSRGEMKKIEQKEEESLNAKFLEIDGNWDKEEIELYINKWKEDSKKYVEDQFAVMRRKLKTALDGIANLVMLPETSTTGSVSTLLKAHLSTRFPNRTRSGIHLTEPTDEVGRKLYAALQGISIARLTEKRAKSLAPFVVEKNPEATLTQELESAINLLKPPDDSEKSLEPMNSTAGEVENSSDLSTLKAGDDENPSASAALTPGEVENSLESATLIAGDFENRLESATLIAGEVENPSANLKAEEVENLMASATFIPDKVENLSPSSTMIADKVESPSASATNELDDAKNPLASASTEQYATEEEASSSVNQTIFYLIHRLTSESPREVVKNIDSDELRLQLERFCRELGECTQKIRGLQQSLEKKVVDSIEKNRTILEFFARDALLVKGHSIPRTQEQTQNQLDILLKLVKDYIQPLKFNYDVILDDVVSCLKTKNEILDLVEKFLKLPLTEKST